MNRADRESEPPPRFSMPSPDATHDHIVDYVRRRQLSIAIAIATVFAVTLFLFFPFAASAISSGGAPYFEWDVPEQYWPDLVYLCESIHDGELPYWNPRDRGGYPFYADPQAGTYHPANWAICAVAGASPDLGWANARVIVSFALTGLFALLWFRRLGASWSGAMIGAALIECAPFMRHNWELILTSGFAYVPLMLFAADRLALERRLFDGIAFAFACGLAAWVGSPPALFFGLGLSGLYLAFRLGEETRVHGREVITEGLPALATALILALGLAGAVIVPGLRLSEHSVQAGRSYASFTDGSLGGNDLWALVWPQDGNHLFVGWLALALVPFAVIGRKKDRLAWFFLALALVALFMTMGTNTPVFRLAHAVVPGVDQFRLPHRYESWFGIAIACLAVFGLSAIARLKIGPRVRKLAPAVAGLALVVGASLIAALDLVTPGLFCLALGVLAIGAALKSEHGIGSAPVGLLLVAIIVFDVTQTLPPERHLRFDDPPADPSVAPAVLAHAPRTDTSYRVMDEFALSCRAGTRLNRRDLRGYQDPLMLRSYERVVGSLSEHPELAPQFNVRYALQGPHFIHGWDRHYLPPPEMLRARLDTNALYDDEAGRSVTELASALPFAYFVADRNVEYVTDRPAASARTREVAPSAIAILENGPSSGHPSSGHPSSGHPSSGHPSSGHPSSGRAPSGLLPESVARNVVLSRDRVRFDIHTRRSGYVVVNEAFYPGWTATVNDEPVDIVRANGFVRALRVSAGDHAVEMRFLPEDGVYWRQALLLSMFVVFVGLVVLPFARRFRGWARAVARRQNEREAADGVPSGRR